ncbi:MAG: SOS response-associated peptidase [Ignavibacteria bacterium]|nr:SOS response-associated peptidase [Ignavibacteria bacterium]
MCGRFTQFKKLDEFAERFDVEVPDDMLHERYNAAPTQDLPVIIIEREKKKIELMKWGLIPAWADSPAIGTRMINARCETLSEKPSFRTALKTRRCLIPADGFYEWRLTGKGKQPVRISLKSEEVFTFAGLWETWKSLEGKVLRSFTIITTHANELLAPIHDRMPVILRPEQEKDWLSDDLFLKQHVSMLRPYNADDMIVTNASRRVNSVANDDSSLLDEFSTPPEIVLPAEPSMNSLFD